MKIESLRIENFRSYKDEIINFDNYTCFIGPNGSGKSTVLNALNVFFRNCKDVNTDLTKLTEEDFHHKNTKKQVKITVTFTDIPNAAKKVLSHYVRQDKLVVSSIAKYDSSTEEAEVKQYGSRNGFEEFRIFFESEKEGKNAAELKEIYNKLKEKFNDLPVAGSKAVNTESLRKYEEQHDKHCVLIESQDQFYGASKGENRLAPYVQWVFISASKNAKEECEESKDSALGQLLERTVRSKVKFSEKITELRKKAQEKYQTILDDEQSALDNISESLENRLKSWAHPGINAKVLWKQDSEKSVNINEPWAFVKLGEKGFEGDLARFGHGLQRSYMLALLQELSTTSDETDPTLIMGIEEPEIYQHPPQARYLAEVLHDLSSKNSQIMACSHSPLFVPSDNFEAIRIVREKENPITSYVKQLSYTKLSEKLDKVGYQRAIKENGMLAKLYSSLNPIVNEIFFCNKLILVEGIEDVAYLSAYLMLNNNFTDFRKFGCHIVPMGGKFQIAKPLAIAQLLNISTYVVCDADTDKDEIPDKEKRESEVAQHKKNNKAILHLFGYDKLNEWPTDTIVENNLTMWNSDLTLIIKEEIGKDWEKYFKKSCDYYDNSGNLGKNPLAIAHALRLAWIDGHKSPSLMALVENIISFAKSK
ncbi:ATP-dependent endonuclease [Candidatus Parcubacteria bacterium]|nr:ATP-dependent endonuclease [Candidatus Parcubacteria bacterium]